MNQGLWRSRFREYLEVRNWAPRTVEAYSLEVPRFFKFLATREAREVTDITRETVEEYRAFLFHARHRGKRLHVNTQVSRLVAVRAFLRFLVDQGYLLVDPGALVELPRVPRTLPRRLLSEDEVARLMDAADVTEPLGVRDRAVAEIIYANGMRNSELGALTCEDVNLPEFQLHVQESKSACGRKVPIGEEAAFWLEIYLHRVRPHYLRADEHSSLFLSMRGRRLTREDVTRIVAHLGEAAGLAQRVTPHLLRHCCATHMLARGASLRHIQQMLGHASAETTQRYLHMEISDLRDVHRRCHPRERRDRR